MSTITQTPVIASHLRYVWNMMELDRYDTLGQLLKERRLDLKGGPDQITQPDIAKAIKQSQAQVWKIENGQTDITKWFPERQAALLHAYKFDVVEMDEIAKHFGLDERLFRDIRRDTLNHKFEDPLRRFEPDPTDWTIFTVFGSASAGTGMGADGDVAVASLPSSKLIERGASYDDIMVVVVDGDCLVSQSLRTSRRSIAHGDYVFIHLGATPKNSDIVCVWDDSDGQLLLKFRSEQQDPEHPNEITFYDAKGQTYIRDIEDIKYRGVVFYRTSEL